MNSSTEQIIIERQKAEAKIRSALIDYAEETGMIVESVSFSTSDVACMSSKFEKQTILDVKIDTRLPKVL